VEGGRGEKDACKTEGEKKVKNSSPDRNFGNTDYHSDLKELQRGPIIHYNFSGVFGKKKR